MKKNTLSDPNAIFARECLIRDAYADEIAWYRPNEREVSREALPGLTDSKRADLVTVEKATNVLRIWEFKIRATPAAIGQVLTYLALCRRHYHYSRILRPVLAAIEFDPDVLYTIEALNLGIEAVTLPAAVVNAGKVSVCYPERNLPVFHSN